MVDPRISEATVVYIWGEPRTLPYPSAHPEDVVARCGGEAENLIARVRAILDEAYAEPMQLPGETSAQSATRIALLLGERHPELDEAALKAVADHFAFNTR